MKKYLLISTFLVYLLIAGISALYAQSTPAEQELSTYIKDNYTKRQEMIAMRDGVKLFTTIYEPKDKTQKYPILLKRTPYSVEPYAADEFPEWLGPSGLFAREGYIFVYQDVRGRWLSEGEFVNNRPDIANRTPKEIDEGTDAYDTVDWLIKNVQNNNGRVGMYGISYPGFYTSAGIIDTHPAIKAASPQAPYAEGFIGDDWHHNGALFLPHTYHFLSIVGQPRPTPYTKETLADPKPFSYTTRDGYKYYLEMGSLANSDDRFREKLGFDIDFWNEIMRHPNYDEFWQERNILPKLKNIKCAVMTVGGWFDAEDLYGTLRTYEHIERQNPGIYNVLVMGPWKHGDWDSEDGKSVGNIDFETNTAEFYRAQLELPFFNYFLKSKGSIDHIRELNLFETGTNQWKFYDKTKTGSWGPLNTEDRTLYLQNNGKLDFLAPANPDAKTPDSYDEYVSDPAHPVPYTENILVTMDALYMTSDQRHNTRRPDVLVYQTNRLTEDITVAGDFKPALFVSTSGTDSDFIVKVIDVFPETLPANPETKKVMGGYQMLVRGEPFRARFRNSFSRPEAMQPNKVEKIEFIMPGINHTFKKGHRIMVQIQSSWFPLVDRNPQTFVTNIFEAKETDFQKATQRVFFGGNKSSSVTFGVLKK